MKTGGQPLDRGSALELRQNCPDSRAAPMFFVGVVLFFSSDESDFITGQALVVNGGRYIH